ncbi:o-succinylbenzoate--CoA ligase [Staphylococcus canis]|uniref:2-succinylbenzoate--CoA ligase n=1 Tax=Staphylococcus canis TaxID=2724942 RepID=A0ABS0TAC4_9STAP|nr:o-succinylbenzoate--CoA ligase [Staphylococcus canis]MBI5975706.1 o-succinylbenzoate--CoA ligase [Staphylococcus canis]
MEHWLVTQARRNPDKIAIETETKQVTFKQLLNIALEKGAALKSLNQNRIGLYINNSIESLILIHSAWLYNIEIALINNRLTQSEIEKQMRSIEVDTIVTTQTIELLPFFNIIHFDSLISNPLNDFEPHLMQSEQQIASIMFTSGTTGVQKAVPQTFLNHRASAEGCQRSLGFDASTRWLLVLPLYHISGLSIVLRSLLTGFTVYLMKKFDAEQVLKTIELKQITHLSLVPLTLMRLIDQGLKEPFQLEKILLGGAKLSETFVNLSLKYHLPIYNSFGMTETCSQFLTASPEMLKLRPSTVGQATEDVQLKIVNPNEVGHGELCLKGANVMDGYLYPKSSNQDAFDEAGFFHTGDIASIDHLGYVTIYDRRKDLIISGGENIYPNEIENVAKTHPNIVDAMCVGIKDTTWGQRPKLYLVATEKINDIEGFLAERLAKYKLPVAIDYVQQLPYTSTGKLKRGILKGDTK